MDGKLLLIFWGAAVVVQGTVTTNCRADHVCRRYYEKAFEQQNRRLDRELHARREVLHRQIEHQRRCIHAEIREANQYLRGHGRHATVRSLHRKLAHVNRCFDQDLSALHKSVEYRRRLLRHERDAALRHCRTSQCTDACRSLAGGVPTIGRLSAPHSATYPREELAPARRTPGFAGSPRRLHSGPVAGLDEHHGHHPWPSAPAHGAGWRQSQGEFDWQSLVFQLLARRLNR